MHYILHILRNCYKKKLPRWKSNLPHTRLPSFSYVGVGFPHTHISALDQSSGVEQTQVSIQKTQLLIQQHLSMRT